MNLKKSKRNWVTSSRRTPRFPGIVLGVFAFLLLPTPYSVFPRVAFAEERINVFSAHIEIQENGSAKVQEEIVYDFGDTKRHGIYREIPLIYQPVGLMENTRIELSSISVTDGAGSYRQTEYTKGGNMVTLKVGDKDKLISGPQLYVIRYTVWGAFNTHLVNDEFYWNVTGHAWKVPIDRVRADVLLPAGVSADNVSYRCYVGDFEDTSACRIAVSKDINVASSSLIRFEHGELLKGQGLTIATGLPKGRILFVQPESDKEVNASTPRGYIVKWWQRINLLDPWLLLPIAIFTLMFRLWFTRGRDPKGRGTIIPEYDIPDNLSPLECAALLYGIVSPRAISAAIIDLAYRGYLRIERVVEKGLVFESTDHRLTKLVPEWKELSAEESFILEKIFIRDHMLVSKLKTELAGVNGKVTELVLAALTAKGYYTENPVKERRTYAVVGFLVLCAAFIMPFGNLALACSGSIILVFSWFMPKMTEKGVYTKEEVLGFKTYLSVAEKDRINFANAPEKDPETFEKFLPYAMIFGVEEKWAEQFEGMYEYKDNNKGWYVGGNVLGATLFTKELGGFATSTAHACNIGGGASGGGGFSGGGAGGGGGRSW